MPEIDSEIKEVLRRLREIGRTIPELPFAYPLREPTFGAGASPIEIASLESVLTAPLPFDFLQFQSLCGSLSALDIWNGYFLMEAPQIKALLAEGWDGLPVGGDGGGNMFLMELGSNRRVLKWHHETGRREAITSNFADFLARMAQDWEHFARGDNNWKYMAG